MLRKVSETLEEVIGELGIGAKINQARAIVYWDEVVGKKIAAHTSAYLVRGGTLFVSTSSPTWSQELSLIQPRLIEKLNRRLGKAVIKEIRFQSRGVKKGTEAAPQGEGPDLSQVKLAPQEKKEIERQISQLSSEPLREELRVVLTRDRRLKKWRLRQGWKSCGECGALIPPGGERCLSCGKN